MVVELPGLGAPDARVDEGGREHGPAVDRVVDGSDGHLASLFLDSGSARARFLLVVFVFCVFFSFARRWLEGIRKKEKRSAFFCDGAAEKRAATLSFSKPASAWASAVASGQAYVGSSSTI